MISENALRLLKQRYFINDTETWPQLVKRVVDHVCVNETEEYQQTLSTLIEDLVFLPNSPCLVNSGKPGQGLMACFVAGPTEDTLENHLETLAEIAQVAKKGGGCGFTGTFIRPEGSPVKGSTHGYAYGPNKWASSVSQYLDMMSQSGFRKMALMYTLSTNHPDLEKFIDLKQTKDEKVNANFNQSIFATDKWMVKATEDLKSEEHRLLWKLAENAWNNGEPGLLFDDTINQGPYAISGQKIYATNPCSEQCLPPYGSCNLGSINISHPSFFSNGEFNFERLVEVVKPTIRFLDSVGTVNNFPTPKFAKWYEENRPVGLGIMGYADALLNLGLQYGKKDALNFLEKVTKTMLETSYQVSEALGVERGIPKMCQILGRRNITTISFAPTGSIAFIAGCSHSAEPIFSPNFTRTDERGEKYEEVHPEADKPYFTSVIGHKNSPTFKEHVDVVITAQKWVDSGISKTCNAPTETTVQEIYDAFVYAWKNGVKGLTVYRDNSRQVQVLNHNKKVEEVVEQICGDTGETCRMVYSEGCATCQDCGVSYCSI